VRRFLKPVSQAGFSSRFLKPVSRAGLLDPAFWTRLLEPQGLSRGGDVAGTAKMSIFARFPAADRSGEVPTAGFFRSRFSQPARILPASTGAQSTC
jgi:hypothetical protein